ncbi:MAG TPA: hypothetical protein VK840_06245 [Candidatus Dormibacteraeota bacterium]|jgi:hypothetical protein|nr:hypothetical protein [Candidatus Dormibacteraeota bacterium]
MENYWKNINGVSEKTLNFVRNRVEKLMAEGACLNEYPQGLSKEEQEGARFIRCIETALEENWNRLSEDEKVRIRFPAATAIGQKVEIRNRGLCEIVRYELTKRFGLRVTYKLPDGNMFAWEHWD